MKIEKPGIFTDVASADYFADPCPRPSLTQSIAKILIDKSPAHARLAHPRLTPPTEDDEPEKYVAAQAIGNAAHRIIIGRGKDIAVAPFDNWMTKDAKLFKTASVEDGLTPVLERHHDCAAEMVKAARAQLDALGWKNAFTKGHGEVVIVANEGEVWMRSLVDWMESMTAIYDYKTTGASIAPHVLGLKAEADGWHVQAAMHERILDLIDPQNAGRRKFRFVAQENEPPYALVGVELDRHWLTMGHKKLDHAIRIWSACMATDTWPAYPPDVICPAYPGFRESLWLEREMTFHENLSALTRQPMLTDIAGG